MCLTIDDNVKADFDENDELRTYKIFKVNTLNGEIFSPIYQQKAKKIYKANKIVKSCRGSIIENSIHVYLEKPCPDSDYLSKHGMKNLIVECICKKKNFIAAGISDNYEKSAAFSEVELVAPPKCYISKSNNCLYYKVSILFLIKDLFSFIFFREKQ